MSAMFSTYLRLRLHVSATPRQVIRATYGRLAPHAHMRKYRTARHELLRDMLAYHAQAQGLAMGEYCLGDERYHANE